MELIKKPLTNVIVSYCKTFVEGVVKCLIHIRLKYSMGQIVSISLQISLYINMAIKRLAMML